MADSALADALAVVKPALAQVAEEQGANLLKQFDGLVQEGSPTYFEIASLFKEACQFKFEAMLSEGKQRDDYEGGILTLVRRARTLAYGEAVVASDRAAAAFEAAMHALLTTVASVSLQILGILVKSAAQGAVAGFTGGAGQGGGSVISFIGSLFSSAKK